MNLQSSEVLDFKIHWEDWECCFPARSKLRSLCRKSYYLSIKSPSKPPDRRRCMFFLSPRAPEILFKPELIGRDHCGIHETLFKSILGSDIDLRRSLLRNIVLSGNGPLLCTLTQQQASPSCGHGSSTSGHTSSCLLAF